VNTTLYCPRLTGRTGGVAAEIARLLRTKAAANVAAKRVERVRMMAPGGDGRDVRFPY
jgi:hypothetical protein